MPKVKLVGAAAVHPVAKAVGLVADSVTLWPVTATLSVAVKAEIGTVNELEVAGMLNVLTVGGVVSDVGGRVIVHVSLRLVDTFPAASFAQA